MLTPTNPPQTPPIVSGAPAPAGGGGGGGGGAGSQQPVNGACNGHPANGHGG